MSMDFGRRAASVRSYLVALGVAPTLTVDGEGECLPSEFTDDVLPEPVTD